MPAKIILKTPLKILKQNFLIPLILISTLVLSSCGSSQTSARDSDDSPCNDSLFLVLKKKDYESLTGNERSYFNKMREECRKELVELSGKSSTDVTGLIIIGAAVVVLLTVLLVGSSFKTH